MICQAVFYTTVFWVFSPFDAAAKEIRSIVVHARRRARRSTTALIARSLCAGTVRKLCFRDTKWHRCDSFKPQTTDLIERQSFCSVKYHVKEVKKFFYVGCQSWVCQFCITSDHKSHDVVLLEKAVDDEKQTSLPQRSWSKRRRRSAREVICDFERT